MNNTAQRTYAPLRMSALSILFLEIDTTRFSQPTRHHWRGASRDFLLLALSIISFKLTTPPYRGPNGTSFARPPFDQPLSALSILKTGKRNSLF